MARKKLRSAAQTEDGVAVMYADSMAGPFDDPDRIYLIPLDHIRPAPWNPPARMDPAKVLSLADSIASRGQEIPALIRPIEAEASVRFEIVFGHRRAAAWKLLSTRSPLPPQIPAGGTASLRTFIRQMSEEEAMILSIVENLQREAPTDIEEAETFKLAGERYGESAVKMLAEKLSVSEKYVRKRIEILRLPETAIALWRAGTWHVGHMTELLRVGETPEVEAFLTELKKMPHYGFAGDWTSIPVYRLREIINSRAVGLGSGKFDKTDCKTCRKNTQCQLLLFGGEQEKKVMCLDPVCFEAKQQAWYDLNWASCKQNKFGTWAAIIGDYNTKRTGEFGSNSGDIRPAEKCQTCPKYATIVTKLGEVGYHDRICLGEKSCFASLSAAKGKGSAAGTGNSKTGSGSDADEGPRCGWHGEYFRQAFYKEQVPQLLEGLLTEDPRRLQLALAFIIHAVGHLHGWFCGKLKITPPKPAYFGADPHLELWQILEAVKPQNPMFIEYMMAEAHIRAAFRDGEESRYGNACKTTVGFGDPERQALAEFLDIDFQLFEISDEWMQKKIKGELVGFIVGDSGLLMVPEFLEYLNSAGRNIGHDPERVAGKLNSWKKGDLIELIKGCGVDLRGRLPKEIADRPKLGGRDEAR